MKVKIFIDQGHNCGSVNAGALANGIVEAEVSYLVGSTLASYLNMNPIFEAKCARESMDDVLGIDQKSSLKTRVDRANAWNADLYISIHANASESSDANGSEVYVYQKNSVAYDLAKKVLHEIVTFVKTKDNGVKIEPDFYVLKHTKMSAILVELAYVTNKQDAITLKDDVELYAFAMYLGICKFLGL